MTEKEKYVLSHYEITPDGKILSDLNTRFKGNKTELHYRLDKDGYKEVSLVYDDEGNRQPFKVHRLVALKYIPNPYNYPVTNHKDLNKKNNNVDNLEWCSISYNTQHGFDNYAYKNIKPLKITFTDGTTKIFPTTSSASRYFGYANPTTLEHTAKSRKVFKRGRLVGAKIEYLNESVTTIEKNADTAVSV